MFDSTGMNVILVMPTQQYRALHIDSRIFFTKM